VNDVGLDGRYRYATVALDSRGLEQVRRAALAGGRVVQRDGLAIYATGTACSLAMPSGLEDPDRLAAIGAELRSIRRVGGDAGDPGVAGDDRGKTTSPATHVHGPIAIGALAFDRRRPSRLALGEVTAVERMDAVPVAVVVGLPERVEELLRELSGGGLDRARDEVVPSALESAPPDSFRLESARPHEDFLARVEAAVSEVRTGRLDKVVLAREVTVTANRPLRQCDLLERLRALHPSCTVFAVDGFVGASPELLLARSGREVSSHPLAGTAARSGDAEADRRAGDALLSSPKERSEHRAVVEAVAAALRHVTSELEVPAAPSIVELRNVSHLGTAISGVLAPASSGLPSALELVARLHPTPAIAGSPVDAATEYIEKAEEVDRGCYGGPVGWIDASGDGEFYLGIRSAMVDGATARLFAGVGILADSDPARELAETQLKLQAFLAAAVRP